MMTEKSDDLLHAQRHMAECRKGGAKEAALWWMRVAQSYRQREANKEEPYYHDYEGVWWESTPTRFVNG